MSPQTIYDNDYWDFIEAKGDEYRREREQKKIKLGERAGLVHTGRDEEGELEFIGRDRAWKNFKKLTNN